MIKAILFDMDGTIIDDEKYTVLSKIKEGKKPITKKKFFEKNHWKKILLNKIKKNRASISFDKKTIVTELPFFNWNLQREREKKKNCSASYSLKLLIDLILI